MSERQKVVVALLASALLHLIGMIVLGLLWSINQRDAKAVAPPPPKQVVVTLFTTPPEKKEVKLVPKPEPKARPTPPPEIVKAQPTPDILRELNDSSGLTKSTQAPKHALFSSDIDSVAGSETPGSGALPVPGQAGKERPFVQFENKDYSPGKIEKPPGINSRPVPPQPMPPQPVSKVQPAPAPVATPAPTPIAEPIFKPAPLPMSTPSPNPDSLQLAKAAPTPPPTPFELPKPKPLERIPLPLSSPVPSPEKPVSTPEKLAMLTPPRTMPRQGSNGGFREQKEAVKIEGGISNKGKKGVDSLSTPLGRYRKDIATAISERWNEHVRNHMDLITLGTVRVKFYVTSTGKVEDIKLLSNTSTESFATYTIKSIMEAKLPPLPRDMVPLLENGRLEISEWSFTIYPE